MLSWDANKSAIPDYDRLNTERGSPFGGLDIRVDKKWSFNKWDLEVYLDIQNVLGTTATESQLILDRPLDENGRPIGDGVVVNPDDPINEQRYAVREIQTEVGQLLPTIGLVFYF